MPGALPDGDPAPADGRLPEASARAFGTSPFGVYVHVPFCRTRCGYCDFNTYTATELGGGASQAEYPSLAMRELELARRVLAPEKIFGATAAIATDAPKIFDNSNKSRRRSSSKSLVETVFFGGGTPTLLPPAQIASILKKIDETFGITADAEVTVEANPETVTPQSLEALREAGVTRMSFGMQSAVPHVLATLDRVHQPGRPAECVKWAKSAGFGHVSLDLIYGTPGESDDDWRRTLDQALEAGPDHVSAYALIVEDGTRLAARIRRGEIAAPDDDTLADRYEIADDLLTAAGLRWYEISNWARGPQARCRHNMLYWTGGDWWGVGPGAHSHVGGTRWWNVRHPSAYAARLAEGRSPAQAREVLTPAERSMEEIMLGVRLADGLPVTALTPKKLHYAERIMASALLDPGSYRSGRLVLTRQGRLLADAVARDLTP